MILNIFLRLCSVMNHCFLPFPPDCRDRPQTRPMIHFSRSLGFWLSETPCHSITPPQQTQISQQDNFFSRIQCLSLLSLGLPPPDLNFKILHRDIISPKFHRSMDHQTHLRQEKCNFLMQHCQVRHATSHIASQEVK